MKVTNEGLVGGTEGVESALEALRDKGATVSVADNGRYTVVPETVGCVALVADEDKSPKSHANTPDRHTPATPHFPADFVAKALGIEGDTRADGRAVGARAKVFLATAGSDFTRLVRVEDGHGIEDGAEWHYGTLAVSSPVSVSARALTELAKLPADAPVLTKDGVNALKGGATRPVSTSRLTPQERAGYEWREDASDEELDARDAAARAFRDAKAGWTGCRLGKSREGIVGVEKNPLTTRGAKDKERDGLGATAPWHEHDAHGYFKSGQSDFRAGRTLAFLFPGSVVVGGARLVCIDIDAKDCGVEKAREAKDALQAALSPVAVADNPLPGKEGHSHLWVLVKGYRGGGGKVGYDGALVGDFRACNADSDGYGTGVALYEEPRDGDDTARYPRQGWPFEAELLAGVLPCLKGEDALDAAALEPYLVAGRTSKGAFHGGDADTGERVSGALIPFVDEARVLPWVAGLCAEIEACGGGRAGLVATWRMASRVANARQHEVPGVRKALLAASAAHSSSPQDEHELRVDAGFAFGAGEPAGMSKETLAALVPFCAVPVRFTNKGREGRREAARAVLDEGNVVEEAAARAERKTQENLRAVSILRELLEARTEAANALPAFTESPDEARAVLDEFFAPEPVEEPGADASKEEKAQVRQEKERVAKAAALRRMAVEFVLDETRLVWRDTVSAITRLLVKDCDTSPEKAGAVARAAVSWASRQPGGGYRETFAYRLDAGNKERNDKAIFEALGIEVRTNLRSLRLETRLGGGEWLEAGDGGRELVYGWTHDRAEGEPYFSKKKGVFVSGRTEIPEVRYTSRMKTWCAEGAADDFAEWLAEVPAWDGVARMDDILTRCFAVPDEYRRIAALAVRTTMLGAINRAFRPGAKHDTVAVLSDKTQGTGKSTFWETLLEDRRWFSDSFSLAMDEGKKREAIQGCVLLEMGELAGHRHADYEALTAFLSRRTDKGRLPYDRLLSEHQRRAVFTGTTNKDDALPVMVGENSRRWIVVPVPPLTTRVANRENVVRLVSSERLQLWAEALEMHRQGVKSYLNEEEEEERGRLTQRFQKSDEVLAVSLQEFLAQRGKMKGELACVFTSKDARAYLDTRDHSRGRGKNTLSGELRALGCVYENRQRRIGGVKARWWSVPARYLDETTEPESNVVDMATAAQW